MNAILDFKIFSSVDDLPLEWEDLSASNIFLSPKYLRVLELASPPNMECHFIGIFHEEKLVGIAIAQYLNIFELKSFGERDQCIKAHFRKFIFKRFGANVLLLGNNMLTGQNAYLFSPEIDIRKGFVVLQKAISELQNSYKKRKKNIHVTSLKDFSKQEVLDIKNSGFNDFYNFSTQPNMVLSLRNNWENIESYIDDLTKKYRDQYKRTRKKGNELVKRRLTLEEIKFYNSDIITLYKNVAFGAPFNTFFLPENHFIELKKNLAHQFLFYGYFKNDQLIGFNTLIKNGKSMETYFLGYDPEIQKEHMLYLNMLYDMITYCIKNNYSEIIFARTALEIKSSIGAIPKEVFGLIKHDNRLIQKNMNFIFNYLEPKIEWIARNPFKN